MTDDTSNSTSSVRQRQFDEILAALMRAIDEGETVDRDAWLAQHPDFVAELKEFFAKHERLEKLVRPLRQAAANVLHVRCPHCHNPIELLDHAPLSDISCPSCGSSFSLIGDDTLSHDPRAKSFGHFELLDRVGMGQFGSVWKARDTKLDRTVAIKIPRNGRMDSTQTEMFLRDARAAAQLKHPNIVSVHEVGNQDDTVYIVSDFIQGATLKEWTEAKRLTPREAAVLCVTIAKALHHAHEAGVIHRDLKPSNIMMDADGEPHIVDFGLAKREAGEITMTVEGQILGTPAYMSPEQARGEGHTVDRRADIYSLGVILFELLTGELPFRGDKQMLIVQILKDESPSPRILNVEVPRDLETICLKCLEKALDRRYLTATAVADDLKRFLHSEPILARPISRIARGWRWSKRKPTAAGLIVVAPVIVGLLVALLVGGFYNDRLATANRGLMDLTGELEEAVEVAAHESEAADQARDGERLQRVETERALSRSEEFFYFLRIAAAEGAWRDDDVGRADRLLDECPERFRNWEWLYLKGLCHADLMTISPSQEITSCDVSSDGLHIGLVLIKNGPRVFKGYERGGTCPLKLSDYPSEVLVLDRRSGGDGTDLRLSIDGATCIRFTPDGEQMLVGKLDGTIDLLDFPTGRRIRSLGSNYLASGEFNRCEINDIAVNPSDQQLAVVLKLVGSNPRTTPGYETTLFFSIPGDDAPSPLSKQLITYSSAGTFSPDGKYFATARLNQGRGSLVLRRVASGDLIAEFSQHASDRATSVQFSSDGKHLVSGHSDSKVRVWTVPDCTELVICHGHKGAVLDVKITPDGGHVVSSGKDSTIRLWNLSTGQQIRVYRGHTDSVRWLKLSTDGSLLFSSSDDNTVKMWNVKGDQTSEIVIEVPGYSGVAFSPNDKRLGIATSYRELRMFDIDDGQEILSIPSTARKLVFGPSGETVLTGGGPSDEVTVRNGGSMEPIFVKEAPHRMTHENAVALSKNGEYIAAGTVKGVIVWNATNGDVIHEFNVERDGIIWDVDFAPHSNLIAYSVTRTRPLGDSVRGGLQRGEVRVCDFVSGERILVLNEDNANIRDIEFSPDGSTIATAATDQRATSPFGMPTSGSIHVWDVATGKIVHNLSDNKYGWCLAFNSDGDRLAVGMHDGGIKILDSRYGQELLTLGGHTRAVVSVAFSHDGRKLASAGADFAIRLWKTGVTRPLIIENP